MPRREEAVYIISVAAELSGVHPQTLRIYERRGLISPYRTPGGTRRYSDEDLQRLNLIQELTSQGMNLEGVRRVLELQLKVDRLEHQVQRLRRLLADAERRMAGREGDGALAVPARRANLPDLIRPDLLRLRGE
jgi:MerR family transcriptional regulator/heat shock protein HspR